MEGTKSSPLTEAAHIDTHPECYTRLYKIAASIVAGTSDGSGNGGGSSEEPDDAAKQSSSAPTDVAVHLARMFVNSRDYQVQKYVMFGILECHLY